MLFFHPTFERTRFDCYYPGFWKYHSIKLDNLKYVTKQLFFFRFSNYTKKGKSRFNLRSRRSCWSWRFWSCAEKELLLNFNFKNEIKENLFVFYSSYKIIFTTTITINTYKHILTLPIRIQHPFGRCVPSVQSIVPVGQPNRTVPAVLLSFDESVTVISGRDLNVIGVLLNLCVVWVRTRPGAPHPRTALYAQKWVLNNLERWRTVERWIDNRFVDLIYPKKFSKKCLFKKINCYCNCKNTKLLKSLFLAKKSNHLNPLILISENLAKSCKENSGKTNKKKGDHKKNGTRVTINHFRSSFLKVFPSKALRHRITQKIS